MGINSESYTFCDKEIKALALLLRANESELSSDLDKFNQFLEKSIYSIMTIEEAECFYSGN